MKPYKTMMREASAEYVVNRSRFIGSARPVQSAEEALAFLERERTRFRDANHHCYAYIVGQNAGIMRYSDDGEPGGTAGMPIMEVLKAKGVVDCAVVVTRYFGGILLGTGGLVRAYSHSCVLALHEAGICEMHPTERWMCEVPYSLWDKVQHYAKGLPIKMENTDFSASVMFEYLCKSTDSSFVLGEMTRMTDGKAVLLKEDEFHAPWETEDDAASDF